MILDEWAIKWDFKTGMKAVEVFENWQLLAYAIGALDFLKREKVNKINLTIVQPNAFHVDGVVRTWSLSLYELYKYTQILAANAKACLTEMAPVTTGTHCQYCEARHDCAASIGDSMRLFEIAKSPLPLKMNSSAQATQLEITKRAIEQLKYVESGLEEQLKNQLKKGEKVQGYLLDNVFSRQKWLNPAENIIELGIQHGVQLSKPAVLTPSQALRAGLPDDVVKENSFRESIGMKLVKNTADLAKKIFG